MKDFILFVCVCVLVIFGVNSCTNTEWYKEDQREKAAQVAAAAIPHAIRHSPGCTVFAFHANGFEHYYTQCETTTTTERTYTEPCGKNCVKTKQEVIVTKNK